MVETSRSKRDSLTITTNGGSVLFSLSIGSFVALLICHAQIKEYQAATPTTAIIESCMDADDTSSVICTGTWTLGGKSYHGDIDKLQDQLPPGTTVDVLANKVCAFAMTYTPSLWDWTPAFIVGGLMAITVVLFVLSENRHRAEGRLSDHDEDSRD